MDYGDRTVTSYRKWFKNRFLLTSGHKQIKKFLTYFKLYLNIGLNIISSKLKLHVKFLENELWGMVRKLIIRFVPDYKHTCEGSVQITMFYEFDTEVKIAIF